MIPRRCPPTDIAVMPRLARQALAETRAEPVATRLGAVPADWELVDEET